MTSHCIKAWYRNEIDNQVVNLLPPTDENIHFVVSNTVSRILSESWSIWDQNDLSKTFTKELTEKSPLRGSPLFSALPVDILNYIISEHFVSDHQTYYNFRATCKPIRQFFNNQALRPLFPIISMRMKNETEAVQTLWNAVTSTGLLPFSGYGSAAQIDACMQKSGVFLCNINVLNLTDKGLKLLPSQIKYLPNLTCINVAGNAITHFPEEIKELKSLQAIYISPNQQINVSPELEKLLQVDHLYVWFPQHNGNCAYLEIESTEN